MSQSVGIGVVGRGFGERVHLPGWASFRDQGVRIASVCSRDPAAAAALANRFAAAGWTTDWRELIADPAVSVVSIATPPATHVEVALAAIRAGKAVLCEKPLGLASSAAQAVAEATVDGPPALVDFSFRALPAFREARDLLQAGAGVERFRVTWHIQARDDAGWRWSWKDSATQGGGALALYGVHVFDYVEWLLGPVARIQATLQPGTASRLDGTGATRPVSADEGFTAHLELEDGTTGEIDVSLVAAAAEHRIEFLGTRDPLVLEPPDWPGMGPDDARLEPFATLASDLVSALREGRPATPAASDGARALALVEAARASAETVGITSPATTTPVSGSR